MVRRNKGRFLYIHSSSVEMGIVVGHYHLTELSRRARMDTYLQYSPAMENTVASFMTKFLGAMVFRCPGVVQLYA
jgi:hypothetical protein